MKKQRRTPKEPDIGEPLVQTIAVLFIPCLLLAEFNFTVAAKNAVIFTLWLNAIFCCWIFDMIFLTSTHELLYTNWTLDSFNTLLVDI